MSSERKEKNFLKAYGDCHTISIVDFMNIWRAYDSDRSGFIEVKPNKDGVSEFRKFIVDLLELMVDDKVSESDIDEYIELFLAEYDANEDGKFGINELVQILPVEENFLQNFLSKSSITAEDIDKVFKHYDKDGSDSIDSEELTDLVKDLLRKKHGSGEEILDSEVEDYKKVLMQTADINGDGQISKKELHMLVTLYFKETTEPVKEDSK